MDSTQQEIIESIEKFNNTSADFPSDKTIVDLFLEQVKSTPDNVSVIYDNQEISFRELDVFSSQFANYLITNHNIKRTDFVGLMIERSEWIVISILGILKAGATYVPIDIESPTVRKDFIKSDSDCKFIVDDSIIQNFITSKEKYASKLPSNIDSKPNDLAYVMYTSGTTGNPKGVMIKNIAVVNLITSQTKNYGLTIDEKFLQFSNYFFDASIEQIFLALFNGATTVIVDKQTIKDHAISDFIKKHSITHLNSTPSYLETITDLPQTNSLKRIVAGGESCSINLAQKLSRICDFYNAYGLTETTVTSTLYKYSSDDNLSNVLPIGKPINNTKMHVLSSDLEVLPIGTIGDLYLSGLGLAKGYLNLPELSKERFVDNPFESNAVMYKTGDLAKWLPDGNIEFLGRKDDQVKIGGYRIELGEVEAAINSLSSIKRATVISSNHTGEAKLVAYIESENDIKDSNNLRYQLSEILPDYMIPALIMWLDDFPMTTNGKVDKKNLPLPEFQRSTDAPPLRKAKTKIEKQIAKIWSETLHVPQIGIDDNFFEMGGTSLLTKKVAVSIAESLKVKIPVTKIYQYPTISSLANFLDVDQSKSKLAESKRKNKRQSNSDIAIIGMAGRFPGANSIEELWEVLRDGKETISFFTPEELDKSIPEALRNNPNYIGARGIVPSAKTFDAKFFGLNPKLASAMDPQQRLFLEISWEALEQSGYLPSLYDGKIGVYAGVYYNTYYLNNVFPNKELMSQIGDVQANTINDKDYIATRTAYHLNLKGPAVSVHSACSTSLLAIAQAAESIRNGQCDIALAGGSSVTSPMYSGHLYQEGSMLSANGQCRSFDANATGTMFCDGAGVVLLKSLEDAKRDGDIIHGVIKGIGLNNDGGEKGSFTAPSIEGQAGAIRSALLDADVKPSEVSYIEAHGTATPLGDPIEIEGLRMAFGEQESNGYCAIGSIKSNIGHLTAAAGVAGLIKTTLALKHRQIPASLGFEKPNPSIDFENSPFFVNNKLRAWESDTPRIAGVSSFGVGGTNVHIVLEEYVDNIKIEKSSSRPLQLLTWSAKSQNSQEGYKNALSNYLKHNTETELADIAYSLTATRDIFQYRSFSIANTTSDAKTTFNSEASKAIKSNTLKVVPSELAFLFPGQGSQYLQMGKALYDSEVVYKDAVDHCAKLLKSHLKLDIREIIYPEDNSSDAELKLKDTKYTQPALFVVEYALSQLWINWGIKPTLVCGHSIGEFVAAHLAGIFTLEDALHLITVRGKLVSELPGGSMLSVRANLDSIKTLLPDALSIAAINSDRLCVVSGSDDDIKNFAKVLTDKGIANMLLLTSHAFHSSMMDPILDTFEAEVKKVTLNVPRITIVSTVTGEWMTDAEATNSKYWTNHLREAVNFSGAMETVLGLEDPVLLEIGPGRALTTLSQQKKGLKSLASISSLSIPKEGENAYHTIFSALGDLWLNGVEANWKAFYGEQTRQKVLLPAYVFDRKPCWLDPPLANTTNNKVIENQIITNEIEDIIPIDPKPNTNTEIMRKPLLLKKIADIIEDNSGIEIEANEAQQSFLELGLDSLVLTQMAITCKNEFGVPITFRQLNDEFGTPNLLAEHLDKVLPEEMYAPAQAVNNMSLETSSMQQQTAVVNPLQNINIATQGGQNPALNLIAQQLQLLGQQLELLQGNGNNTVSSKPVVSKVPNTPSVKVQNNGNTVSPLIETKDARTEEEKKEHQKPFGASPKIDKKVTDLTSDQSLFLNNLINSYNTKTAKSKAYAQHHRSKMADPRVVTGFKPLTKELVYPLVIEKSSGNKLWDLDGNEYMDILNGFGACLFGHQPDFIKEALHDRVEKGFEVGPQHPLAGEVCEMLCEFTGHDRAALCNTGSEAVLGAMRIARTVTGRSLIVAFSRSYHGINDEVIVRGSKKLRTFPAAAGILPGAVQNMLILDYGTEESLAIIKERAHEIAAVLVEPVQSRRPDFQPIEFLKEVREITEASESVLIFDEIITGFRMHPGGAQALFGIKADVATYGKVIGGGMSIGAILGERKYMDALDGGHWQFGDDSSPEVGVTYFAGTFVRHPLALAATKASLIHFKNKGKALQDGLAALTERLATELNIYFRNNNLPMEIAYYRSLWRLTFLEDIPYSELFFVLMREKGFHIWDGFPCYMTEAFTEEDIDHLIRNFVISIEELIEVNIFKSASNYGKPAKSLTTKALNTPPVPNARLGLDEQGNPAWFVNDEKNKGEYVQIDL